MAHNLIALYFNLYLWKVFTHFNHDIAIIFGLNDTEASVSFKTNIEGKK